MHPSKRRKLEAAGWRFGSAGEFLGLTREEAQLVELKLSLAESLRRHRLKRRLTQVALARQVGSSQSRIAKLESGGPGVSMDLLFRALFAAGATTADIARELRPRKRPAA